MDKVHYSRLHQRDPAKYPDLADLVDLAELNDGEIHQKIKDRFDIRRIYTYLGPSLIIMNPFKLYKEHIAAELKEKFYTCFRDSVNHHVRDLVPHVWGIATQAMLQLIETNVNQSICISGESGAGKTFAARDCIGFITSLNN